MSIPKIPFGIFLIPGYVLYNRHASFSWRDKYLIICQISQGFCSSSQPPKGSLSQWLSLHLLATYHMPRSMLSTLYVLSHLMYATVLYGECCHVYYYYPNFVAEAVLA